MEKRWDGPSKSKTQSIAKRATKFFSAFSIMRLRRCARNLLFCVRIIAKEREKVSDKRIEQVHRDIMKNNKMFRKINLAFFFSPPSCVWLEDLSVQLHTSYTWRRGAKPNFNEFWTVLMLASLGRIMLQANLVAMQQFSCFFYFVVSTESLTVVDCARCSSISSLQAKD